jgi:AraC-like DNA-binding protein
MAVQTVSAGYCRLALKLARKWGIDDDECLLAACEPFRGDLSNPEGQLRLEAATALLEAAAFATGEPAFGICMGLEMCPTVHGFLGFAAIAASTIGEAVRVAARYAPLWTTAVSLFPRRTHRLGTLVVRENAALGSARATFLFSVMIGLWRMACEVVGGPLEVTMDYAFPKPDYYARFEHFLPPARFGQPTNGLSLENVATLGRPLLMSDIVSQKLAAEHCDRRVLAMGLDGQVSPRVRLLAPTIDPARTPLKIIAGDLQLAPRTLRRRLRSEGTTFSALMEDDRKERALLLLRGSGLSIRQIGERLGYSDTANFTRAFRRWTGLTPSRYRTELRSSS